MKSARNTRIAARERLGRVNVRRIVDIHIDYLNHGWTIGVRPIAIYADGMAKRPRRSAKGSASGR